MERGRVGNDLLEEQSVALETLGVWSDSYPVVLGSVGVAKSEVSCVVVSCIASTGERVGSGARVESSCRGERYQSNKLGEERVNQNNNRLHQEEPVIQYAIFE